MSAGSYNLGAPHEAVRYVGESAVAGSAMVCDRCGSRWYPDMGETPHATCDPTPQWRRDHPEETED